MSEKIQERGSTESATKFMTTLRKHLRGDDQAVCIQIFDKGIHTLEGCGATAGFRTVCSVLVDGLICAVDEVKPQFVPYLCKRLVKCTVPVIFYISSCSSHSFLSRGTRADTCSFVTRCVLSCKYRKKMETCSN